MTNHLFPIGIFAYGLDSDPPYALDYVIRQFEPLDALPPTAVKIDDDSWGDIDDDPAWRAIREHYYVYEDSRKEEETFYVVHFVHRIERTYDQVFPIQMTWVSLAEALLELPEDERGDDWNYIHENAIDDTVEDKTYLTAVAEQIEYYAGEATPQFRMYLKNVFKIDLRPDAICWDPADLPEAFKICDLIVYEYDSMFFDDNDDVPCLWKLFGLGGDDDVDYHGGYIMTIFEIMHCVWPRKTLPLVPTNLKGEVIEKYDFFKLHPWIDNPTGA